MKCNFGFLISLLLLFCVGIKADLTKDEKKTLLELHKKARDDVHAPDMKEISWDDKMAEGSQEYANKCLGMVHSGVGPENLAGNSLHDVTAMFNQWMDEKAAFDKSGYRAKFTNGVYNNEVVGHYSQIVWADNSKIGCGLTYCDNLSYKNLLVCRYETGNIIGYQVYGESNYTTIDSTSLNDEKDGVSDIIFDHKLYHILAILLLVILF